MTQELIDLRISLLLIETAARRYMDGRRDDSAAAESLRCAIGVAHHTLESGDTWKHWEAYVKKDRTVSMDGDSGD